MRLVPERGSIDPKLNIFLAIGCLALYLLIYSISSLNLSGLEKTLFHVIILLFPATGIVAIGQIIHHERVARAVTMLGYFLFVLSILSIITDAVL